MTCEIHQGDSLDVLRGMPDASVDAIVTDPPYGLAFMGKRWDYDVPSVELWAECLRVVKPGGHLLAFAGTRTQHRMAVRIEDGGFEIRDMLAWVYGSGFPKSLDVSRAIDKAAGAEREVVGAYLHPDGKPRPNSRRSTGDVYGAHGGPLETPLTAPATEAAKQWSGWHTALKPSLEPITLARAPFRGTVADNVLKHGTGAINVDGCRVGTSKSVPASPRGAQSRIFGAYAAQTGGESGHDPNIGRFPANLIHDGSPEVVALFPHTQSGGYPSEGGQRSRGSTYGKPNERGEQRFAASEGSAARFFYCAKASKSERGADNTHPTVKPLALMRYLVRLVTPPGGIVLDPFMGSGTTALACRDEGFRFVGIEREAQYIEIARRRLAA
jgi:DNA modification methylase